MSSPAPAPRAPSSQGNPFTSGNFRVEIQGIPPSSFSEVSGLDASIDVVDYRAGDAKGNTDRKLPGLNKFTNITLKRGITQDGSLWNWFKSGLTGNVTRADLTITLLDQAEYPVILWKVHNAWPCRWVGPLLAAKCSDVAIETLEICHEGLELTIL